MCGMVKFKLIDSDEQEGPFLSYIAPASQPKLMVAMLDNRPIVDRYFCYCYLRQARN